MSKHVDRSVADFIAGALSPPLIMALVGSLVFFLLEILYQGIYRGVLHWVLFFFVFGAVLIARIAMNNTGARAAGYALVLGGAVWAALQLYVAYPENDTLMQRRGIVNLGLIVLIWWSAHRLTRDCTQLEDDEKNEGVGLLEAIGLERRAESEKGEIAQKGDAPGLAGWWQRFERYWERKKKKRTPGVWVVLFSLAALPLFGLGQSQIPAGDAERRRYCFQLLIVYVGSGLGLLLTTSYLGMRTYLKQRKLTMPLGITMVWLAFGAGLIGALLLVGGVLPRPADPQPLWEWAGIGSPELKPAPFSPLKAKEEEKKEAAENKDGKLIDVEERKADGTRGEEKKGEEKKSDVKKGATKEVEKGVQPPDTRTPGILGPIIDFLLKAGKWLIIVVVVGVIAFWLFRWLLHFLANFTLWARALLAFFDRLRLNQGEKSGSVAEKPAATPRAFASFANPFQNGQAEYMAPADLVRFSFAALVAWGREHDMPRALHETAGEYARRIGEERSTLGEEAAKLAELYGRLAYSTDALADAHVKKLRNFWRELTREVELVGAEDEV